MTLLRAGLAASLLVVAGGSARGATLEELLRSARPADEIPVIVTLRDRADLRGIRHDDRQAQRRRIVEALREKTALTQRPVRALLERHRAREVTPLWIVNGLAARATSEAIRELQRNPLVERVVLDETLSAPVVTTATAAAPGWNLAAIRAPALWRRAGVTGQGVVVASMDTGVDLEHPDLQGRWRGGPNGWFDPYGASTTPYDVSGHGTQTMGILVGGDAGGTAVGVAPGATWIAAKMSDDAGTAVLSKIHLSFQWLLDPDGDPATPDAPDVVNASWGILAPNACDLGFEPDVEVLRAAEILVVFAAGNSGPNPLTSLSPANNPGAFSVGATDAASRIAFESSRGPSACTGGIFPDLAAPGVNVLTTDLSFGGMTQYTFVSGTSYAAPHVAGAAALILSGHPGLPLRELEQALRGSARDLGAGGPDDTFGFGLLDCYEAFFAAGRGPFPLAVTTTSLPSAQEGAAYGQLVRARGGFAPYAWSVTAGSLPPGLSVDARTGLISGNSAATGTSQLTIRVEDTAGSWASQPFTLVVYPVAPLTVAGSLPRSPTWGPRTWRSWRRAAA